MHPLAYTMYRLFGFDHNIGAVIRVFSGSALACISLTLYFAASDASRALGNKHLPKS